MYREREGGREISYGEVMMRRGEREDGGGRTVNMCVYCMYRFD